MASIRDHEDDDEPGNQYVNELLADITADENMANTPQDKDKERRRAKNAMRAKCRRKAEARARRHPQRNLNDAFTAATDCKYATPIGNITEAAILLQRLPQNPET
jgi:chromatin segregation and condensation protein Rec8/ScpA/Scc1 (kleisin family)